MIIETISFLFGFGFSLLVYQRSIRRGPFSRPRKIAYFLVSTAGITGMVWLSGVLVAHFLKKLGLPL
jgi:hypothetical protein